MYLMFYLNEDGRRIYTLKKSFEDNRPMFSAHPGK